MKEVTKKNIEDILALTPMQEGMLYHYLKKPGSDYYCEQLCLRVSGEIHPGRFQKAWHHVVQANQMLRTFFRWEKLEKPIQIILKQHTPDLRFFDLATIQNHDQQEKQLEKIKQEDSREKFDLREVPFRVSLCKISRDDHCIIMSNHHILLDGWSTGIILQEFFRGYDSLQGLEEDESAVVLPLKPSFGEFLQWQRERDKNEQQKFWEEYFKGFDTQTELPVKRKGLKRVSRAAAVKELPLVLETPIKDQIETLLKEKRVTGAAFFYSAWGILLQKYCSGSDVVFGTTVSGRSAPIKGIENMVGLLINTLPLRAVAEPAQQALDLIREINHTLPHREKYENTPLPDIKKYCRRETGEELFDSILVIENYPLDRFLMGEAKGENNHNSLQVRSYAIKESTPHDLVVAISFAGEIRGRFIYDSELYAEDVMQRLAGHFIYVMQDISEHPGKKVSQIDILSLKEKQQILYEFNHTRWEYPRDKTIQEIFAVQVEKTPDYIVVVAQGTGGPGQGRERCALTYRELNKKSRQLAVLLREKNVTPDTPVAIIVERSLEMMVGILAILKAGGAYLPIDPDYPAGRIDYMLKDSGAKVLLAAPQAEVEEKIGQLKGLPLQIINMKKLSSPSALTLTLSQVGPANLAYIMYTSGSTGGPKGVMVEHRNVVRLVVNTNFIELSGETRVLQTGAPVFDATTFEMWGPLLNGGQLFLVDKEVILDANRLGLAIKQYRITTLWLSSPLFNQLTRQNPDIFSGLSYLLVGGDVLSPRYINLVRNKNKKLKIINGYGPTENTTFSTTFLIEQGYNENIPIGRPINNSTAYIVDKYGHLQPVGVSGELWVGGDGVARGYLNNPELTAEKFLATEDTEGTERLYRTGDLVCWLPDGNIEFSGRIDHQIKIRGFRIELGEVENQLLGHEKINQALVIAREDTKGEKYICAYVVMVNTTRGSVEKDPDPTELREYLSKKLPDYMIPSCFMGLEKIPLNPNGKVDIKALPQPGPISLKKYIAPQTPVEKILVQTWANVLGIDAARIGINDDFFELGGHSLNITTLMGLIHKKLHVQVPFSEIFINPTVKELAAYINLKEKESYSGILPVEEKEYYPLSPAQKRLFVLQQMDENSVVYNIHGIMLLEGMVDKEKLAKVFRQLIARHESLRTSFHLHENQPVQKIHREVEFEISFYDSGRQGDRERGNLLKKSGREGDREIGNLFKSSGRQGNREIGSESSQRTPLSLSPSLPELFKVFIRPFELSHAPLLRVGLLLAPCPLPPASSLLIVDMHHIISDGTSIGIMSRDFLNLYRGETLPLLQVRYRDYSRWLLQRKEKPILQQQEAYWLEKFSGEIPLLNLPTDFPRPALQDFSGAHVNFEINSQQTTVLKNFALEENTTLFGMLLALFYILLAKLSGQEDIVVGTPGQGRQHIDLSDVLGMFVNTLAVRNYPTGEKRVRQFAREVRDNTAEAFENQEFPFEELVEQLNLNRDASRNPLFDVAFAMQDALQGLRETDIPGLEIKSYPYENHLSKFDLTFTCEEENEGLRFTVEYCSKIFSQTTIARFITYFKLIVSDVLCNKELKIGDIEIIPEEEKQEILTRFNHFEGEFVGDKTLVRLFREQVDRNPDSIAVVGRVEGGASLGEEICHLTYRELDEKSVYLGRYLCRRGVTTGDLVGIMAERTLEMIMGILGILTAGAGYVPLNPKAPWNRSHYILAECNIGILLTTAKFQVKIKTEVKERFMEMIDISGCLSSPDSALISTSTCQVLSSYRVSPPGTLAYVIFTSGSTGMPKGVPITHANLSQLLHWGYRHLGIGPGDRTIQNLSYFFDWSVWEIFITLTMGAALYMVPGDVLLQPGQCIDFLETNGITILHITPTQYSYIVNTGRKTGTLKYLFIGAEKLGYDLVERSFAAVSLQCRVFNMYGPTEATIISAVQEIHREDYKRFAGLSSVPIGKPTGNIELLILDSYLKMCPVNIVGELYIAGDGLSRGYLNNPELTAEKFFSFFYRSYRSYMSYISKKIYKTGDLARWLQDGNIEYLGRVDHQVKIRGFRIELGEIETQITSHEQIKESVVIDRLTREGDRYLCAYIVPGNENQALIPVLKEYLSSRLPDYMIPPVFVPIENIPLNPNGKVDRKALPEPDTSFAGPTYTAPRDPLEKQLAQIWAEVLGRDSLSSSQKIGIEDNFFEIGGHSLKAALLIAKIHQAFNVKVQLVEVFVRPTIRQMAEYIKEAVREQFISIEPVEKRGYYPLSSAQKRLYLLQGMDPGSTAYNIPDVMTVTGNIKRDRFQDIFRELIHRHESLRTSFITLEDKPVQRIHDKVEFEISFLENSGKQANREIGNKRFPLSLSPSLPEFIKSFLRPFDLSQAPLLRVGLLPAPCPLPPASSILIVDMHHIISDGMSIKIFVEDFAKLYAGEQLPPLSIHYKDYAAWRDQEKETAKLLKQAAYWQDQFHDEIPVLQLPLDFVRPRIQSFAGSRINVSLDSEETRLLRELVLSEGTTLYILLLSLFNVFLAMITNQESFVVGTATAGRKHAQLEQIIGMFVNTIALINYPGRQKGFNRFLEEVNEKTLQAFENQEYPFEELVETVEINRDPGRNPLFDVMLVLQNFEIRDIEIPGLRLKPYDYENPTSKFDLTVIASEAVDSLHFTFEYSTKLFKEETIRGFAGYFKRIVSILVKEPGKRIGDIEIISQREKEQILIDFNDTRAAYPCDKPIHHIFEEQAARTPDALALVHDDYWLTYSQLNEKANHLAHRLRQEKVEPGTVVAIMVTPSIEMIYGVLAVLKAGAAYLPIDPAYPPARVTYMLEDSRARILLKGSTIKSEIRISKFETNPNDRNSNDQNERTSIAVLNFEDLDFGICLKQRDFEFRASNLHPSNLAYIIYTSGSTGRPKGVLIEHHSLTNLCYWHNWHYLVTSNDRACKTASFGFDVSVWEIFPYLAVGASIFIPNDDIKSDIYRLNNYFEINQISIAFLSTQFGEQFMEIPNRSLRVLLVGGDKLNRFVERDYQLANNYGPTENTVVTTSFIVTGSAANIPIGQPVSNVQVTILNQDNKLQPVGIPGELCISGEGLARGYLNRPELTAEKFNHDLWDYRDYHDEINKSFCGGPGGSFFKKRPLAVGDKIYKTGDLARWLADGNIEFMGRIDQQVKIRGFRIETGEIEQCLFKHDSITEAVVLAKEDGLKEKHLCAYIVAGSEIQEEKLREFLSSRLPAYMVPAYFVIVDKIPLTPSGKIDRAALPEPLIVPAVEQYRAPRDEIEEKLASLWADILGIEKDIISIEADFFALGGHSLRATLLITKIHKTFDVSVPLTEVFANPILRALAAYIKKTAKDKYISIAPVERKEYYALSSAQKRLYFLQRIEPENIEYNMPKVMTLQGELNRETFNGTFKKLIKRHESLRTSFQVIAEEPVQRIHDKVEFEIECYNSGKQGDRERGNELTKNFIRPFDLRGAPLLRVGLIKIEETKYLLMMDMHHIISDGISMDVFIKEFMLLLSREVLPVPRLQYKDYSEWQRRRLEEEIDILEKQRQYWLQKFKGNVPVLNLPIDYPRQSFRNTRGKTMVFEFDAPLTTEIKRLIEEKKVTLYIFLLAVYTILLSRYTNQEDIVVGSPTAGRNHVDLEKIMGMFVNMLAMRNFPRRNITFEEFLEKVKENALNAYENQDYQFEKLVSELGLQGDSSRNPLFDTVFQLLNIAAPDRIVIGGNHQEKLVITPYEMEYKICHFDLYLVAVEGENTISLNMEYSTALFRKETIEKFLEHYAEVLKEVVKNSEMKLQDIQLTHGLTAIKQDLLPEYQEDF